MKIQTPSELREEMRRFEDNAAWTSLEGGSFRVFAGTIRFRFKTSAPRAGVERIVVPALQAAGWRVVGLEGTEDATSGVLVEEAPKVKSSLWRRFAG